VTTSGNVPTVDLGVGGAHASQPAPYLRQGDSVSRYVVLKQLGEGGMGVVYAAYDPELDRKVALKLLQAAPGAGGTSTQGQARLLREAQAMARLSHPHVSAVFDVGTYDDRVFVAMELVEGQNLRQWLKQKERGWREVSALLRDAGRGLAAAHAAGLVHRDVKPDNILVGADGRAKVTDFGLAQQAAQTPAPDESGRLLGTVQYMSPERLGGRPSDARSDQFSFCVMAFEALNGKRPARGLSAAPGSPMARRVPSWLRRLVARGLSENPEQRFSSMQALLDALDEGPRRVRRRWLAGAGAVLAGAMATVAVARGRAVNPCAHPEAALVGIWDEPRKAAVHQAFAATRAPFAEDAWRSASKALDAYARDWVGMDGQACVASRAGGTSAAVPLLQRLCLERRLDELRALAQLDAKADARIVEKAVEAAHALTPVRTCSDLAALQRAVQPPPESAKARVEALRTRLVEAKALLDSGKYAPATEIAKEVARDTPALAYPPLTAEAESRLGWLQVMTGDLKAAELTLAQGALDADAAGDDSTAAEASTDEIYLQYIVRDFQRGHDWNSRAEAKIRRLGGDERLEGQRLNWTGALVQSEGKLQEAGPLFDQALELRTRVFGPEHPEVGKTLFNMAFLLEEEGRFEDAMPVEERALALFEAALGKEHPLTAHVLQLQADLLRGEGDYAKAEPIARRALEVKERALGAEHPFVAEARWVLADIDHGLGRDAEAKAGFERAKEAFTALEGADHPDVAQILASEGAMLRDQGADVAAWGVLERCLSVEEKALGLEHPRLVKPLCLLADVAATRGDPLRAEHLARRALAIGEKAYGADGALLSYPLLALGRALEAQGRSEEAMSVLERASRVESGHALPAEHLAATRIELASCLWHEPAKHSQARALAEEARAMLTGRGDDKRLRAMDGWLAHHPP
jgi:tetratricopeptide (TPR) repeat protein